MGYNGIGYQRWIATLKPRKFLGKRSKPDGGGMDNPFGHDINDYYHLKSAKLDNLAKKEYPIKYRLKLQKQFQAEKRKQILNIIISLIVAAVILLFIIRLFINNFD